MKKVFLFFTVAILSTACMKKDNPMELNSELNISDIEQMVLYKMRNKDYKVSVDEATQRAMEVIDMLDENMGVKSGVSRKIASIRAIRSNIASVKSSDGTSVAMPDTMIYLVNFADSAGYTIISADTRISEPILAYAPTGSIGNETQNAGLSMFAYGLRQYIQNSIVEAELKQDSLINEIVAKLFDEEGTGTKAGIGGIKNDLVSVTIKHFDNGFEIVKPGSDISYEVTTKTDPAETVGAVYPLSEVEWDQGDPYNVNIPFDCSYGKAPVGCTNVATAIIMSYWKHPSYIDGHYFDWELLNQYTGDMDRNGLYKTWKRKFLLYDDSVPPQVKYQIPLLMERISYHTKTEYGCDGSGASESDAMSFLRKFGYRGGYKQNYDYGVIVSSLSLLRPVFMSGWAKKTTERKRMWYCLWLCYGDVVSYSEGHAWVIDGFLQQKEKVTTTITKKNIFTGKILGVETRITYNVNKYLHHNWGYNGSGNGFYLDGAFNQDKGTDVSSGTKSVEGDSYDFKYDLKIYPYIYK